MTPKYIAGGRQLHGRSLQHARLISKISNENLCYKRIGMFHHQINFKKYKVSVNKKIMNSPPVKKGPK